MIYSAYSKGANFNTLEEQRIKSMELLSYGLEEEFHVQKTDLYLDYSPLGKPSFRDYKEINMNIAHCRHGVTVVLSRDCVGIDIEQIKPYNVYAAKKTLDENERKRVEASVDPSKEFFRYWTLKESYIKAIGMGLSYPMKSIHIILEEEGQVSSNQKDAIFSLYENDLGFIVATCRLLDSSAKASRLWEYGFVLP